MSASRFAVNIFLKYPPTFFAVKVVSSLTDKLSEEGGQGCVELSIRTLL
jgi:hypothetical protein